LPYIEETETFTPASWGLTLTFQVSTTLSRPASARRSVRKRLLCGDQSEIAYVAAGSGRAARQATLSGHEQTVANDSSRALRWRCRIRPRHSGSHRERGCVRCAAVLDQGPIRRRRTAQGHPTAMKVCVQPRQQLGPPAIACTGRVLACRRPGRPPPAIDPRTFRSTPSSRRCTPLSSRQR